MANWQLWLPPALSKPRFRLYVAGHTVSVIGGWIQQVAISWLVFRLTNSAVLLGLAGFLLNIFYLLLGSVGGLAADRLPRLKTLIVIDIVLGGALRRVVVAMAAAGVTNVAAYLAIAALIGAANAFEMPVRQTLMRVIVEERALVTSALGDERHGVQRRAHGRAGHRRHRAGLSVGGLVLCAQCAQLCGHHRRALGHAPAARTRPGARHRLGPRKPSAKACRSCSLFQPCATCCPFAWRWDCWRHPTFR